MHQFRNRPSQSLLRELKSLSPHKNSSAKKSLQNVMSRVNQNRPITLIQQPRYVTHESVLSRLRKRNLSIGDVQSIGKFQHAALTERPQLNSKQFKTVINPKTEKRKQSDFQLPGNNLTLKKQSIQMQEQNFQNLISQEENNLTQDETQRCYSKYQISQLQMIKKIVQKKEQALLLFDKAVSKPSFPKGSAENQLLLKNKVLSGEFLSRNNVQGQGKSPVENQQVKKQKNFQFYDKLIRNLLEDSQIQKRIWPEKEQQLRKYSKKAFQPIPFPQLKAMSSFRKKNQNQSNSEYRQTSVWMNQEMQKQEQLQKSHSTGFLVIPNQNLQTQKDHMPRNSLKKKSLNKTSGPSNFEIRKKETMRFRLSQLTCDKIYRKKINSFLEFLFKVNFSNSIYVDLSLSCREGQSKKTYKIRIGQGNNSKLIKSIVKRRFWLEVTSDPCQANIVWTQHTQKELHSQQLALQKQFKKQQPTASQTTKLLKLSYPRQQPCPFPYYTAETDAKIMTQGDIYLCKQLFLQNKKYLKPVHPTSQVRLITNHLPNNSIIGSKKILFKLMHWYYQEVKQVDPFEYLPHTYHIVPGDKLCPGILSFKDNQPKKSKCKTWIVKPGENTNRGKGIEVLSTQEVEKLMRYKKFHKNGELQTYIVQKYLTPFLYQGRKFDIRHYLLLTSVNGILKAYWYKDGYIRTSSQKYDAEEMDNEFIHLTNDAIQKQSEDYGKYEPGNKLSYTQFQRYLDNNHAHKKLNFRENIVEKMKKMTIDVIRAGFMFLDSKRGGYNFQLFGMDFMIDNKFKPYLIEINANPCLEISCPLLEGMLPILVEHTFRLAVDPLMPPTQHYSASQRYQLSDRILDKLNYELIFDQKKEGNNLRAQYKTMKSKFELDKQELEPEEEFFEDDGEEITNQRIFEE